MSGFIDKEQELECRIERLEATINKSNFSLQRGVMPLGEWVENVCPKLPNNIQISAWECLGEYPTQKEMDIFIRCCMAMIRQEFETRA